MYSVPAETGVSGPLEPRRSPATWLRIVYGVWLDQRWYWREVHPRLRRSRRLSSLYLQALAGALIVLGLLLVIPALILFRTEPGQNFLSEEGLSSLISQLLVPFGLFLVIGLIRKPVEGLPLVIGLLVGFGLSLCLFFTLQYLSIRLLPFVPDPQSIRNFGPPDPTMLSFDLLIFIIYALTWPLAQGLATMIATGTLTLGQWNLGRGLLSRPAVRLLLGLAWLGAAGLISIRAAVNQWSRYTDAYDAFEQVGAACLIFVFIPGFLLGASLAMRQVPDLHERSLLAGSEQAH
jgi:hypothetical protein